MIPVDGCSINPARSLATAVTNDEFDDHWYVHRMYIMCACYSVLARWNKRLTLWHLLFEFVTG